MSKLPASLFTAAGALVPVIVTGLGTDASPFVYSNVLTAGATYYADFGSDRYSSGVFQWVHSAPIVITGITYQSSALARSALPTWAAAAGGWVVEPALTTITAAGGSAGTRASPVIGATAHRYRGVLVVGATGGSCVPFQNWKPA